MGAAHREHTMHRYHVRLIHRVHDWDASFTFNAPDARTAKKWALCKMLNREAWLAVEAKRLPVPII